MNKPDNIPITFLACLAILFPAICPALPIQSFPLIHTDPAVKEIRLNERNVCTIPVAINRVTTVSFPGPISAIDAALVTVDGKTPGLFQLAHKRGSYFFSVRALVKNAMTNVNVRWNNRTYVIRLHESGTPLLSVIFKPPNTTNTANTTLRIPHNSESVTPALLLGLLDKAKAYPILKTTHPESLAGTDYLNCSRHPQITQGNGYEVRLEEVFRFDQEDTLVFRVTLHNKTDHPIRYARSGFAVRVGERFYTQSISDASGVMPPKSDTRAYFAITGTPDGGRNDLSLKNHFNVVLADQKIEQAANSVPINDGTPLPKPTLQTHHTKGTFSK